MVISAVLLSAGLLFSAPEVSEENQLSLNDLLSVQLETGSFLELDLKNSPMSMTLIPKDQINNSGARHLSELLEIYVPGFQYMANKWNGYVWGMRGVTGDKNDKIIVLVNGRKMNMQSFHGFAQEYTLGLLGDIERVEVLRGPAGLVYGSGAIAGVVNIVTKKGEDTESFASIKVENNLSNGFYAKNFEGAFYGNPDDDHHLAVHIGMRESEGYGENVARQFGVYENAQGVENGNVSTNPELPGTDKLAAPSGGTPTGGSPWATPGNYLASLDYSVGDFRLYVRGTRQVDEMAPYFYPGPWRADPDAEEGDSKFIRGQEYILGTAGPTSTERAYHHEGWLPHPRTHIRDNILAQTEYQFEVGEDKVVLDAAFMGTSNRLVNQAEFGVEESNIYTVGERHYEIGSRYLLKSIEDLQLAFGAQYQLYQIGEDMGGVNQVGGGDNQFIQNVDYHNIALFTEGFYEINEQLGIEAGVRYDLHTRTDGVFSPKAALIYQANDDHTIKFIVQSSSNNGDVLSYELSPGSSTFTPTRYENETVGPDASPEDLGLIIPEVSQAELHNIQPERSVSYEIATNHTLGDLSANTSVSYTQLSDLILYNSDLARPVNLGAYDAISIELDMNYNNEDLGLLLGANLAYQAPIDFSNSDLSVDLSPSKIIAPAYDEENPIYDTEKEIWVPNEIEGETQTFNQDVTAAQITADGWNFNSIHTLTTKYFADYKVFDYLTFHTNLRLFHGLRGRQVVHAQHEANNNRNINFLGIDQDIMAKWNMAFLFNFDDLQVGFYGYDLLAEDNNLHAARWQQMAAPQQAGVFTVDQRTYAIKVTQKF